MSKSISVADGRLIGCLKRHEKGSTISARHINKRFNIFPIQTARPKLLRASSSLGEDVKWLSPESASIRLATTKENSSSIQRPIMFRVAKFRDIPGVAGTHCEAFYPDAKPALTILLWLDKCIMLAVLLAYTLFEGAFTTAHNSCIIAVRHPTTAGELGQPASQPGPANGLALVRARSRGMPVEAAEARALRVPMFSLRGNVAGSVTVDNMGIYIKSKPEQQPRHWIAYISNLSVARSDRRQGIARQLMDKAEDKARSWGCRTVALHCDRLDPAAYGLYRSCGYRDASRFVGGAAKGWPAPTAPHGAQLVLMVKRLRARAIPRISGY